MNEFVNPQHRGVNLPEGFKDLMDVLKAKDALSAATPIFALHSKRPAAVLERSTNGLSQVERFLNFFLNSKFEDSFLSFVLKSKHMFVLKRFEGILKVYVSFGPGDLILEKTLREIFGELGAVPILNAFSPINGQNIYCFQVRILGTPVLEFVRKVLGAYGVSDTDPLSFLLRA